MKKAILATLLTFSCLCLGEKPAPNPANYTIGVHVAASHLVMQCSSGLCGWHEVMDVVIGGKKYQLSEGSDRSDLLRIGDYKAQVVKDETTRSYEYMRTYEFLFADGKTRDYFVVGEE
jgi:hypothetical protein